MSNFLFTTGKFVLCGLSCLLTGLPISVIASFYNLHDLITFQFGSGSCWCALATPARPPTSLGECIAPMGTLEKITGVFYPKKATAPDC